MTTIPARPHDQDSQAQITPSDAIAMLRAGNRRFLEGAPLERNWADDVSATAHGQYPYAVVLGCIDSRVPVETVFDQGIGDIFTPRVAGNIVNEDLLGSMEFACKLAGSKAILVLGHTSCGAVKGAIEMNGDVVIERGAEAQGTITGDNVEIQGTAEADVSAERGLVIGASGAVQGDVQATTLTIHPDASLKGRISMRLDLPSELNGRGSGWSRR